MRIYWAALVAEHLRGGTTYKALAAKNRGSERTIERRASRGIGNPAVGKSSVRWRRIAGGRGPAGLGLGRTTHHRAF